MLIALSSSLYSPKLPGVGVETPVAPEKAAIVCSSDVDMDLDTGFVWCAILLVFEFEKERRCCSERGEAG